MSKSYAKGDRDIRVEVNRYLFYELDIEGEEGRVSESWPFKLRELAGITDIGNAAKVFEFRQSGDEYFVQTGSSLSFWIKDGMSREELRLQMLAEGWIAEYKPADVDTGRPDDPALPSTAERRRAIEQMAREAIGKGRSMQVLEGLFFSAQRAYVALIEDQENGCACLVGSGLAPYRVRPSEAAPWRRLAIAVGEMVQSGKLTGPDWQAGKDL